MDRYGWQDEAYQSWVRAGRVGLIIAPTGTGKSELFIRVMREYSRSFYIAPTRVAIEDMEKRLRKRGVGRVVLMTYALAAEYQPWLLVGQATLTGQSPRMLIVFDEAHHLGAPKWCRVLNTVDGMDIIGGTATDEGLPDWPPVIYRVGIDAVRNILPPVELHVETIRPTISQALRHRELCERAEALKHRLAWLRASGAAQEKINDVLVRIAHIESLKRSLSMESGEKLRLAVERMSQYSKTITFVETIGQAKQLEAMARAEGLDAVAIHSGGPGLAEAKLHRHIVAVRMLDEGIDMPEVEALIFLTNPKRLRRAVQRVGRGMRGQKTLRIHVLQVFDENQTVLQYAKQTTPTKN
jgi:superfamily II DNA or RNA helicase